MAEYLDIKQSHVNNSKYHYGQRNRLFKNLEESNCDSYMIYNTEKANGENTQVSYNYEFNAWVICSKNVSLLARDRQDVKKYKEQRYNYAQLMADAWFDLI